MIKEFLCKKFIKKWIVIEKNVKDSVSKRYRMRGEIIDEKKRRLDWIIGSYKEMKRVW